MPISASQKSAESSLKLSTYPLCALTIKTFNAWQEGEQIRTLRFRAGEKFPAIQLKAKAVA